MRSREAFAKINLGLVVGPVRPDGKHEVVTLLQRIGLADTIEVEPTAPELGIAVEGYEDTIVRSALAVFGEMTGDERGWHVRIDKRIPVAAGLGGGSADAAVALRLANEISEQPLPEQRLHEIAAGLGADVPFFLRVGAQLATGDGSDLASVTIPHDVPVVLVIPRDEAKQSTGAVYARFDDDGGTVGFDERRSVLLSALDRVESATDLASLPGNDLASSTLAVDLQELGAFRADVSGAGPAVYGLFEEEEAARDAARVLDSKGRTWLTRTVTG
ncbi:MAG: hypothetical protein H0U46_03775, partial [Actinobacteria bacterium]|nr:hypothetical protein [Actinomycetota bacterium]